MRHLLTAHQQESFLPFSSRQSLSCCLSRVAKRSTPKPNGPSYSLQNRMVLSLLHQSFLILALFLSPQNLVVLSSFTSEPHGPLSIYLLQNLVVLPFTSEPRGLLLSQNLVVLPLLWLPRLGLNPSAHLPLQPHFRLLLQSATPANIPVFFQLYWAAIVSLGRCGPMAWSQSSPSSHAGPVTRGSCFPLPSWMEVTPIRLTQSLATAI